MAVPGRAQPKGGADQQALKRTGRLIAFLRRHRHEVFDEAFQAELAKMYCDAPRGVRPLPPTMLAMVTLLQAYEQKSDAAAVEQAVFDMRWQMVLDCLGDEQPPFSQGVLVDFRRRLVAHNMDKRLLERAVELAEKRGEFGAKQLRGARARGRRAPPCPSVQSARPARSL